MKTSSTKKVKTTKRSQYLSYLAFAVIFINTEVGYASKSNTVYLYKGDGVSKISFNYEGNKVASGRSHDDKLEDNDQHDDYLKLDFHADHNGSTSIANSFNNEINYDTSAALGLKADPGLPEKMNFYFYGELYINGNPVVQENPYDVGTELNARNRLGQTYQDGRNNWWFNSTTKFLQDDPARQEQGIVDFDSNNYMTLVAESNSGLEQYCISQHGDDYYKFTISRCGLGNQVSFNKKDNVNSVSLTMLNEGLQVPTHTENGNIVGDIAYYPSFTKFWNENDKTNYLVNVERKLSKDLATSYNSIVGTESNMIGLGDPLNTPDDLYFYFGAEMKINDRPVVNTVYFGEGNDNGSDWWAGTSGGVRENNQLAVYTEDGQEYCLSQDNDSNDTFDIGSCDDGSGDSHTSIHDNTVKLYPGSGVQTLQFSMNGFRVSDGEPYHTSLAKNKMVGGYLELDFQAGRHKTGEVGDSFIGIVGQSSEYGRNTGADYPDELNFYFKGPLEINGSPVINEVYLGQGHSEKTDDNNWWFGSKGAWRENGRDLVWVKTQNGKNYCISAGNEATYSFMISDKCPDSGTTLRLNKVTFYAGEGVDQLGYNINFGSANVTKGQPHQDILAKSTMNYKENSLEIEYLSGRQNNADVAKDFMLNVPVNFNIYGLDAAQGGYPEKLNFYFIGQLQINDEVIEGVYLGQGHKAITVQEKKPEETTTNWWIATTEGVISGNDGFIVTTKNQNHYCISDANPSHKFKVSLHCPNDGKLSS